MMEEQELQGLADDIKARGLLNGIVYQEVEGQRVILDGRNRLRACEMAGIPPFFVKWDDHLEVDGQKREQYLASIPAISFETPTEFIISQNLHRRHLTTSQRVMVATEMKKMFEAEAKERMLAGRKDPTPNLEEGGEAAEKAARLMNVSKSAVYQAQKVMREAPPEVVEAVKRGEVAVSAAAMQSPKKKPEAQPRRTPPATGRSAERWTMKIRRDGGLRRVPRAPKPLAKFLVKEWPPADIDRLIQVLHELSDGDWRRGSP